MNQEVIDIIIPMYNAEKTIVETLRSVMMQSYTSWRVIIIDDGSTDKSADIVKKYIAKDSRIEYFYKENGGIVSARTAGIKQIENKYVMMMDSDDIIHPQCLEIFQSIMEETKADMVMSESFQNMTRHGHFRIKGKYNVDDVTYEMIDLEKAKRGLLGEQNYTPTVWDKLFRSDVIKNALEDIETIPKELKTGEDMCMNLCIYIRIHSLAMAKVKLYNYRYSSTFHNKTRDSVVCLNILHKFVDNIIGNLIHTVIIISVFWEISLGFIIHNNAMFIPDGFYFGIFNGRQGICHHRKTGDSGSKPTGDFLVMKGHLQPFIAVFIMHIVYDI